ncbi:MAG: carboxypeptidase regulatory-like domain-containing protein [Syntrophomonas sp.]
MKTGYKQYISGKILKSLFVLISLFLTLQLLPSYADAGVKNDFKVDHVGTMDGSQEIGPDSVITVSFTGTMERRSLNEESFYCVDETTQQKIKGITSYFEGPPTVFFKPLDKFITGHQYKIIVKAGVRNENGNPLNQDYSCSFTGGEKLAAAGQSKLRVMAGSADNELTVVSVTPENGAGEIDPLAEISAELSQELDESTVNESNVLIETLSGDYITYSVDYDMFHKKIIILAKDGLLNGATYKVTLKSSIKDMEGNSLGLDYIWMFTARSDTAASIFDNDYRHCSQMAVKGDKIAWLQKKGEGNYQVFAADLVEGFARNIVLVTEGITSNAVDLAVYENMVVWADCVNELWALHYKNISTGEEKTIAEWLIYEPFPDVFGQVIVYVDSTGSGDIMGYDMENAACFSICTNEFEQTGPRIYGHRVVWVDHREGNADIYLFDTETQMETVLASGPSTQENPDIWEDTVVWNDQDYFGCGIYYQRLNQDEPAQGLFADYTSYRVHPRIYGQKVIWSHEAGQGIYIKEIGRPDCSAVYVGSKCLGSFGGWKPTALNGTHVFLFDTVYNDILSVDIRNDDEVAPSVIEVYPKPGSRGLRVGEPVAVKFSRQIDSLTVNSNTFYIKELSGDEKISADITCSAESAQYLLKPAQELKPGTAYEVTVSVGVHDLEGRELTPKTWTFQTASEDAVPVSVEANYDTYYPSLYEDNLIWVVGNYANNLLCRYDHETGRNVSLFSSFYIEYPPRIYGDKIVVPGFDVNSMSYDIYTGNYISGQFTTVCDELGNQILPNIYGNRVLWVGEESGELWLKDTESNVQSLIASDVRLNTAPSIWKNTVAWSGKVNGVYQVHIKDLATDSLIVDNTGINQTSPQVWKDKVVWKEEDNLWAGTISPQGITRKKAILAEANPNIYNPYIYGSNIVWQEKRGQDYDVFLYNLATGEEKKLIGWDGDQYIAGIFGDQVLWSNGWSMAYTSRFAGSTPDTEAPLAPANAKAEIDARGKTIVSWDRSTDNLETTAYQLERSNDQINWESLGKAYEDNFGEEDRVFFTDSRAVDGGTYFYRVFACDAAGNRSLASDVCQAYVPQQNLRLIVQGGANQTQTPGKFLNEPVAIKVVDQYNRPQAGQEVKLTILSGGASIEENLLNTGSDGMALFRVKVEALGSIALSASIPGEESIDPLLFSLTGIDDTYRLQVNGTGQTGKYSQPLSLPFAVTLTDSLGNPVPGVRVNFNVVEGNGTLLPEDMQDEPVKSLFAVTGSDGTAKTYGIPGFGANVIEASLTGLSQKVQLNASGTATATIEGNVTNYQELYAGKYYTNLEVYSVDPDGTTGPVCKVDGSGHFTIPAGEGTWKVGLRIDMEEYGSPIPLILPAPQDVLVVSGPNIMNFNLIAAPVKITGKVTDENGDPFLFESGNSWPVNVWASSLNHPAGPLVSLKRQVDAAGNFELYLAPGSYSLGCWVMGNILPPERNIEVSESGVAGDNIWIKVPKGVRQIVGHTFGADERLANVLVTAWSREKGLAFDYSKDDDITKGLYNLHLPAGSYELRAFHSELGELAFSPSSSGNPVDVTAADQWNIDFIPQYRTGTLQGKITLQNESREAVAGAVVNAFNTVSKVRKSVRSNARGEYQMELPAGNDPYQLEVWHKDYGRAATGEAVVGMNLIVDKNFSLINPCQLSGHVYDGEYKPLAGVLVSALSLAGGEYIGKETAADGSYLLNLRPGGSYRLSVWAQGFDEQSTEIMASDRLQQDFNLTGQGTITGLVKGDTGGLPNVWVEANSPAGKSFGAFTGMEGRFTITLPQGTYQLMATKPGYALPDPLAVQTDSECTVNMITTQREIKGVVFDYTNQGVPYAEVWVQNSIGDIFTTKTDVTGTYTVKVYPDTWQIQAAYNGARASGPSINTTSGNCTINVAFTQAAQMEDPGLASLKTDKGGIIQDSQNGMQLVVPPGSIASQSEVSVVTAKTTALAPSRNYQPVAAYDFSVFTGKGAAIKDILSQNMEARIRYTRADLEAAGIADNTAAEDNLIISYYDEAAGNWIEVPCMQDSSDPDSLGGGTFVIRSNHFTKFSVVTPKKLVLMGEKYEGGGSSGGGGGAIGNLPETTPPVNLPVVIAPNQPQPNPVSVSFSDLKGHWAENQIMDLAQQGLIQGSDGKVRPDENISRAEFAALLVRVLQLEPQEGSLPFKDLTSDAWYYKPLAAAYSSNLIKGCSADEIKPEAGISREQLAAMLGRALELFKVDGKSTGNKIKFSDEQQIAPWARDHVYRLAGLGIIGGYPDGSFRPAAVTTRAEGLVVMNKILQKTSNSTGSNNDSLFPGDSLNAFNKWHDQDVQHLKDILTGDYADDRETARTAVYKEWQEITTTMSKIADDESYTDPVRGYTIYGAVTSGKLHVLSLAKAAREGFLELDEKGTLPHVQISDIYPDIKFGASNAVEALTNNVDYLPAAEDRYVSLDTAKRVLNSLALPEKTLQGYSVFLMPYEFAGLGGYSFSSALPHVEEAAFISAAHSNNIKEVEKAIAHEAGHFLHHQFIGEYTEQNELWKEYLNIRGETWQKGGWDESTTENFAEDFRIACGGTAADMPHSGKYGTPGPELKAVLAKFFQGLPARVQPLPVEFDNLSLQVPSLADVKQVNGWEETAETLVYGRQLQVKGTAEVKDKDYEPVLYLTGDNYEKCWPLTNGTFMQTVDLPGTGKYDLIAGIKKGETIITCQLFKIWAR